MSLAESEHVQLSDIWGRKLRLPLGESDRGWSLESYDVTI